MRTKLGEFQIISALVYFAAAAHLLSLHEDIVRWAVALTCLLSGALILMGRTFPLRLMAATLFVIAAFAIPLFVPFDESGMSTGRKAVVVSSLFLVAAVYLFFLKRFEAARGLRQK